MNGSRITGHVITSSCQIHFNQNMKTLYNIYEGLLKGQEKTMKQGDQFADLVNCANKELNIIVKNMLSSSSWKKIKRPLYDYSGDHAVSLGNMIRYAFKASCVYIGKYLGNNAKYLTIILATSEGEDKNDKHDWTVQIILEPDKSDMSPTKYSTINTIFNLPIDKYKNRVSVTKDVVSKFSDIDVLEKFLRDNPEIMSYYYERP